MTPRPIVSVVVPILLFLINTVGTGQVQKDPSRHRLLWRITMPGIPGTSYLFGTMHIRDERAFAFGDSVLPALRRCEAFAMEVDMDSVMYARLDRPEEYLTDNTGSESALRREKRIEKALKTLTIGRRPMPLHKNDYPMDLDLYLNQMARIERKACHGLESIADGGYGALQDSVDTDDDSLRSTWSNRDIEEAQRRGLMLYEQGDIDGLYVHTTLISSDRHIEAIVTRRNETMMLRILPLIRMQPTFIAVGAAHLPGERGLIELLRRHGCNVEPVLQTFNDFLPPRNLSMQHECHVFTTVDSVLSFSIPIPMRLASPEVRDAALLELPLNGDLYVGVDAAKGEEVRVLHLTGMMRQTDVHEADLMNDIIASISNDVDTITAAEDRVIAGKRVRIINAIRQNSYITYLMIVTQSTISTVTLSWQNKESQLQQYVENSLFIGESRNIEERWETYVNDTLGLSVEMPTASVERILFSQGTIRIARQRMYMEGSGGNGLQLHVLDAEPGMMWLSDSFRQDMGFVAKYLGLEVMDVTYGEVQGYPSRRALLGKEGIGRYEMLVIIRDDREYYLRGGWTTELGRASVQRFLSSLKIIPYYRTVQWQSAFCMDSTITVSLPLFAPSPNSEEYEAVGKVVGTNFQDTVTNTTWFVGRVVLPRYQTFDGSRSAAMDAIRTMAGIADSSIVFDTMIVIDGIDVRESHWWIGARIGMHVQRMFFCGDELYVLSSDMTMPTYRDQSTWSMPFATMRCKCPDGTGDRFRSKAAMLFDDIESDDTAKQSRASSYLWGATMNPSDYDIYATRYVSWVRDTAVRYQLMRGTLRQALFSNDAVRTRRFLLNVADTTSDERARGTFYRDVVLYRDTSSIRMFDSLLSSGQVPDSTWRDLSLFFILSDSVAADKFVKAVLPYCQKPIIRDLYLQAKLIQYRSKYAIPNKDYGARDSILSITDAILEEMKRMNGTDDDRNRVIWNSLYQCLSIFDYFERDDRIVERVRSLIRHTDPIIGLMALSKVANAGQRLQGEDIERFVDDASRRIELLRICDDTENMSVVPARTLADTSIVEGLLVNQVEDLIYDEAGTSGNVIPSYGQKGYRPPSSIVVKDYQEENPDYRGRWILVKFRTNLPYGPDVWYAGIAGPFFPDMRGHIGKLSFVTKYEAFDDYDADEHARLLMEFKVGQDTYEDVDDE